MLQHAKALFGNQKCSDFVRKVIRLVMDRMLVIEPIDLITTHDPNPKIDRRMSSQQAAEELERIWNVEDLAYFNPSATAEVFEPKSKSVEFDATLRELRWRTRW